MKRPTDEEMNAPTPGGRRPRVGRVAMLSVHTSPLDQPGTGDAGGMNVYMVEVSRRLAARGIEVEIFTRATAHRPPVVEMTPGVLVRHVEAGPLEGLAKSDLPAQLCTFAREVLRSEANGPPGHFDVVHSHYWLSGQVGALARDRWGVPLVHSMHTMAKVKNLLRARGEAVEPQARVLGEEQVVAAADLLIASTSEEARQLTALYSARPETVRVVHPGVDLDAFTPGDRAAARRRVGLPEDALVVTFVGRIQPLKGPDVVVRAAAELIARRPELRRRLVVPVVGGPSGSGVDSPETLARMADELGLSDVVRIVPPQPREVLADQFRAASLVCVPSYNESFGLVAIEAQACGVPVVAARVGGLSTAVVDGRTGVLVDGHDPADYAEVFDQLLTDREATALLGRAGVEHAREFSWDHTVTSILSAYQRAIGMRRAEMWSVVAP